MAQDKRTIAVLKEILDCLTPLREALSDDGLDEYTDALEDAIGRTNNLLYVLTHRDLPGEDK